ncbi:hypothetical protein [Devosia nitrariae]|uniref:DUF2269 family protein n=1 Tax=Devosia nitrariae TaxID=2071872 RepID=A0ABQ5WBI7_9HYPH|nr:hypothetical protein [Devosia nitrariae]GLQ57202.1 hypothetical protein GCM10010862_44610 [Devosia nitrariae]
MYAGVVTIHATAMTAALALMVLGEVLLIPARLGQLASLRLALLATRAVGVLIPVGLLAGIGVVIVGGWPLLTPWLLCSFAMIGLLIVVDGSMDRQPSFTPDRCRGQHQRPSPGQGQSRAAGAPGVHHPLRADLCDDEHQAGAGLAELV